MMRDVEANVNNVDVVHFESHAAGVRSFGEEAEDEGIKPVGGVPISGHALPVCLAILAVVLPYWLTNQRKRLTKTILGLQRRRC